ncbi:sensor histidine kinase [Nitriliruptoraceae bacterium ZYF776]|nr:sensor histidine kinase [Profundirhabdus halotolerans]
MTEDRPPLRARTAGIEWWHLGYLIFLLFEPFFNPDAGTGAWLFAAAAIVAFVPLYALGERGRPVTVLRAAVGTILLAVAVVPFNSGGSVLLVYAAAMIGSVWPRREAMRAFVGLSMLLVALAVLSSLRVDEPAFLLTAFGPSLAFVWVIGLTAMDEARRDREERQLRIEHARVEHLATATERERIARDLHDLLGHTLTSVVVRAQLVQRLADRDASRAAEEGAAIEAAARDALATVRGTLSGWRQIDLDTELDVAHDALEAAGVALEVDRDPHLSFAPSVESALALSLREAVTNAYATRGHTAAASPSGPSTARCGWRSTTTAGAATPVTAVD